MIKVFLSQPMNGKTAKEIIVERERMAKQVEKRLGSKVEILDSLFLDEPPKEVKNIGAYFLGKSIQLIAEADVVFLHKDWGKARGCKFERDIAFAYGIPFMSEKEV